MKPQAYAYELGLRPLPLWITTLLEQQQAPPRLIAHAIVVYDVASELVRAVQQIAPGLVFDAEAVIVGAALHDTGKVLHRTELSAGGQFHEQAGYELLVSIGVPAHQARFAQTHGTWKHHHELRLEDLLVALADTCWKGKREQALEANVAKHLAPHGDEWQVWLALDECIERLTIDAPRRLLWQQQFSTSPA